MTRSAKSETCDRLWIFYYSLPVNGQFYSLSKLNLDIKANDELEPIQTETFRLSQLVDFKAVLSQVL